LCFSTDGTDYLRKEAAGIAFQDPNGRRKRLNERLSMIR